jgi:hypothetical protein
MAFRNLSAFFDIGLDRANQFYTWGWRASIFGALVTFCGVGLLYWGTRVRDHDFESQIDSAHNRATDLEKRDAELTRTLERERVDRMKLEEKQKPRTITLEQKALLLKFFASGQQGPVTVVPKTFDNEAEDYAAKITDVLREANFGIKPPEGPRPFGFNQNGVFAVFKDAAQVPAHAGTIQYCFKQIGVELGGGANPDWVKEPNLVVIAVGQKP